ncbi:membrane protein [Formosa sp. Hel1_33_131]|uniref:DUF6787 family protein n=1 Tax=Formosa sp. Hel1_33_131 TaxID=1336794 RepID=UPI00084E152B|nr:DUF6787 family protein [Formosa sp. Hel1_33_131]AOR27112.1 membrane protein [Formosa sp. Hel1_33_131]
MKTFKVNWNITQNWQLLFPFLGLVVLGYSAFRLTSLLPLTTLYMTIPVSFVMFYVLLKIVLYTIEKLEPKWIVNQRWELIRIFIVFAITGSSSVLVGRPVIKWLGITQDNLNPLLYWILFTVISLFFYQVLLVLIGWVFGQFQFFWNFEKKMIRRFGLGKFLKD